MTHRTLNDYLALNADQLDDLLATADPHEILDDLHHYQRQLAGRLANRDNLLRDRTNANRVAGHARRAEAYVQARDERWCSILREVPAVDRLSDDMATELARHNPDSPALRAWLRWKGQL